MYILFHVRFFSCRYMYLQAMQGFCCNMLPFAAATASCSHCQHCYLFVASAWPALLLASKTAPCLLQHRHSSTGCQCKTLCYAASTTICVFNPFNLMQVPMSRSLLAASPYTVSTSAWISPPYADLTYPEVQGLIQAAYSNTTNAAGLALQQLTSVSKQGVAGNGLCENGEMPSSVGNFTGEPLCFTTHLWPQRSHAGFNLLVKRCLAQWS